MMRLIAIALLLVPLMVSAKRSAPAKVTPVTKDGVRYEAPSECGLLLAKDEKTNAELWRLQVYKISYSQSLEKDVQDVFISDLFFDGPDLVVRDENNEQYVVDVKAHTLKGAKPWWQFWK